MSIDNRISKSERKKEVNIPIPLTLGLGHKPSSRSLDKYVSYLALKKHIPKKKLFDNDLVNVKNDLEDSKELNKLQSQRLLKQKEELETYKKKTNVAVDTIKKVMEDIKDIRKLVPK
jgi:hypothetical protein